MDIAAIENMRSALPVQPAVAPEPDPELVEATRQFEAVFLRQFLGKALEPLLHDTPGSKGPGAGIYQYMMTDVIANSLTEQEQFGISSILQMELAGQQAALAPTKGPENTQSIKENNNEF